jgi:endonuclease/exonuclease/phosphatase family metal-dependent hydrolase
MAAKSGRPGGRGISEDFVNGSLTQIQALIKYPGVTDIYLFTWNLNKGTEAHDLCVEHLAKKGKDKVFVTCLQELSGSSWIAEARQRSVQELEERNIRVVGTPDGTNRVRGLALIYHSSLRIVGNPVHDEDGEFIAAVFEEPVSKKTVGVVGLHAKSLCDISDVESGGSLALLRHAINHYHQDSPFKTCDHTIILGDFNNPYDSDQLQSWHCYYAQSTWGPPNRANRDFRRGLPHQRFKTVIPAGGLGPTFMIRGHGGTKPKIVDFIVVDEKSHPDATSSILTAVSNSSVWDDQDKPKLSDHCPVEGQIKI